MVWEERNPSILPMPSGKFSACILNRCTCSGQRLRVNCSTSPSRPPFILLVKTLTCCCRSSTNSGSTPRHLGLKSGADRACCRGGLPCRAAQCQRAMSTHLPWPARVLCSHGTGSVQTCTKEVRALQSTENSASGRRPASRYRRLEHALPFR